MTETRERSRAVAALDVTAVLAFVSLSVALCGSLQGVPPLAWWPAVVGVAFLGWLASDAVTGLVHWIGDRCFSETTPLLGPLLIQPFREHHRDPLAITRHGFAEVNGSNALAMCPVLVLTIPLGAGFGESLAATLGVAFIGALALGVFATNQLHSWAHAPHAPRLVRWLQRHRLVLSPGAHSLHHRGGHDRAYCVTTGWLNPWIDRAQASPRLGRLFGRNPAPGRTSVANVRTRRPVSGRTASRAVAHFPRTRRHGA